MYTVYILYVVWYIYTLTLYICTEGILYTQFHFNY